MTKDKVEIFNILQGTHTITVINDGESIKVETLGDWKNPSIFSDRTGDKLVMDLLADVVKQYNEKEEWKRIALGLLECKPTDQSDDWYKVWCELSDMGYV
jgi:hypothetical protein